MSGGGERSYGVAVIPGDGIGIEVTAAARVVLDAAAERHGFALRWTELDWGCGRYLATGAMMPADGLAVLARHDAVFLGAVGDPAVPDHVSLWGLLIPIRRAFDQYVNLRPMRLLPGVTSPLAGRGEADIDLVVVRENTEGEYSAVGGRHAVGTGPLRGADGEAAGPDDREETAVQVALFTRRGVRRVVDYAFRTARGRGGGVVGATKSNGIIHTMPFWDEVFREVAAGYPDVPAELCHADALAARFVLDPGRIDVVVASNLFGDILSDLAAAIAGSLGLAASGNINPERRFPSMFESVHGSAPDIAGRGIANPVAQILAGAMMLDHLGEPSAARAVEQAVCAVLGGGPRTPDLGGTASTRDVTGAVVAALTGP
jgi:tartrate dehydrogenase/decarboxylase / D-malate dehydrogenase